MSGTWASGWALNDIVTVGEFAKGVGCVADSTLGVATAQFDFTSLPATYAHMIVVLYARGDTAATATNQLFRMNNDATGTYYTQAADASATAIAESESIAGTSLLIGSCPANTATANRFSGTIIWIPNYAGANHKSITGLSVSPRGVLTGTIFQTMAGGVWGATAAINRLTILPGAGNFVAGSRCSIYVMGS